MPEDLKPQIIYDEWFSCRMNTTIWFRYKISV